MSVLVMVEVPHLSVDIAGGVAGDVGDVETDQVGRQAVVQGVYASHIQLGLGLENLCGGHEDIGHETVALRQVERGQFV